MQEKPEQWSSEIQAGRQRLQLQKVLQGMPDVELEFGWRLRESNAKTAEQDLHPKSRRQRRK